MMRRVNKLFVTLLLISVATTILQIGYTFANNTADNNLTTIKTPKGTITIKVIDGALGGDYCEGYVTSDFSGENTTIHFISHSILGGFTYDVVDDTK